MQAQHAPRSDRARRRSRAQGDRPVSPRRAETRRKAAPARASAAPSSLASAANRVRATESPFAKASNGLLQQNRHEAAVLWVPANGCSCGKSGRAADITAMTEFDSKRSIWRNANTLPTLLLGSHCDETLGRDNHSITPLKPTHEHLDLFPNRLTFGVAYLLKKWAHLWKGILSVLHRCGKRREPLGACYDFDGHLTEAGALEGAAKHSRITQGEHSWVFEVRRRQFSVT